MILERPIGHGELVARLWSAARAGRLPHAMILEGPAGTGKFLALRWFAAGLLCAEGPGEPCLRCAPCKRVQSGGASGNHPDLFVIDPVETGEEQIRIGRIAERASKSGEGDSLEGFLALRSVEGGLRPVILREAQRMNAAAQNALLKTLEEPRPGTLLLLETDRPAGLLATIRSRCVRVRTGPLNEEEQRSVLEAAGIEAREALELARLAPGSPGAALAAGRQAVAQVLELAAAVTTGGRDPLAAAASVWELEGSFAGATPTAKARARAAVVCARLAAVCGDVLRASEGLPAAVAAHASIAEDIVARSSGSAGSGSGAADGAIGRRARATLLELVECRADVGRNLVPEAVLERAFLALARLAPSGGRARRNVRVSEASR